jgi:hypothetical protein
LGSDFGFVPTNSLQDFSIPPTNPKHPNERVKIGCVSSHVSTPYPRINPVIAIEVNMVPTLTNNMLVFRGILLHSVKQLPPILAALIVMATPIGF